MRVVRNTPFECVHLFPGLRLKLGKEVFVLGVGLKGFIHTYLRGKNWPERNLLRTFHFHEKVNDIDIQVTVAGHATEEESQLYSWVNGVCTIENGSHMEALTQTLHQIDWQPEVALAPVVMH